MVTDQPTGFAEGGYDPAVELNAAEYREAVQHEKCLGCRGAFSPEDHSRAMRDWHDKPHRLVLDLCEEVDRLRALLAHPSLLVDRAIEVGGLEQFSECGHCVGHEVCRYDDSQMLPYTVECIPVYQRVVQVPELNGDDDA